MNLWQLEEEDQVSCRSELAFLGTRGVGRRVKGMFVPELWPEQYGRSNPVSPRKLILDISRLEAGPLASDVVKILVANRQVVRLVDFLLHVVDDRPFRGVTSHLLRRSANRAVGVEDEQGGRRRIVYIGCVLFVLVPALRRHVP